MSEEEFSELVAAEYAQVPEKYASRLKNVALLIERAPSEEVRRVERLGEGETLLGLYQGIPLTERGDTYGIGVTLPDTIILYMDPILEEAGSDQEQVQKVIQETLWHEIAHYFGFDEREVGLREEDGTNFYRH